MLADPKKENEIKTNEELFEEREKRFNDTVALRKADRVPVVPSVADFYPTRAQVVSNKVAMFLYEDNGGRIVDASMGIPDESKPENVAVMVEVVHKYGG